MQNKLARMDDVAAYFNVTPETIRNWIKTRDSPRQRLAGSGDLTGMQLGNGGMARLLTREKRLLIKTMYPPSRPSTATANSGQRLIATVFA